MEQPPTDLAFRAVRIRGMRDGEDTAIVLAGSPGEMSSMLGTMTSERLTERLRHELESPQLAVRPVIASLVGDYTAYFGTVWEYLPQHYEGASTLYGRWSGEWVTQQLLNAATRPSRRAPGNARFSGGSREAPRYDDPTLGALSARPRPPDEELRRLAREGATRLLISVDASGVTLRACWRREVENRARPLWFGPRVSVQLLAPGDTWRPFTADGVEVDDRTHRFLVWRDDDGQRALWLFHARLAGATVAESARLALAIRPDVRDDEMHRIVAEI
jgi:hypothetical protein